MTTQRVKNIQQIGSFSHPRKLNLCLLLLNCDPAHHMFMRKLKQKVKNIQQICPLSQPYKLNPGLLWLNCDPTHHMFMSQLTFSWVHSQTVPPQLLVMLSLWTLVTSLTQWRMQSQAAGAASPVQHDVKQMGYSERKTFATEKERNLAAKTKHDSQKILNLLFCLFLFCFLILVFQCLASSISGNSHQIQIINGNKSHTQTHGIKNMCKGAITITTPTVHRCRDWQKPPKKTYQ